MAGFGELVAFLLSFAGATVVVLARGGAIHTRRQLRIRHAASRSRTRGLVTTAKRRWLVAGVVAAVLAPRPAWAHGAGGSTDFVSTALLLGAALSLWWFRRLKLKSGAPAKLRWGLLPVGAALLVGSVTAPSWGPQPQPSKIRPETAARLAILEPVGPAGPTVTLRLRLDGGTIVPQSQTRPVPDGGHIHTYVNGKLVSMADGLEQDLGRLNPGRHTIRAEFVAADHGSFKNPLVVATEVTVGSG